METELLHKKNLLAPKLRFKGFDDGWIDTRLKDITNLITKGTTPQSFSNEGINYVKIEGLVGVRINKEKCLYIDEETHNKELRRSILQNNDLLFAIAGATIGKVAIVTEDILPANTNQALAIIRLKNIKNLNYVLQILQSRIMKKYIKESISVGAQPNLNLEQMGDFRFHIPSLTEQQKIASFLSVVDEKIQQLTRKKELLEQYKKGVMQQLFSGKLRFKDENGKAFPKWEKKELGDITSRIGDGIHTTPVYNDNGTYYFVNGNNLSAGKILINETTKKVSESEYLKHNRELGNKTILLSINGTIGNIAFYDNEKIVLGKSACYININDSVDLMYIYLLIQSSSIINYFNSELTGSTIKNLSLKTVRETPINLPCLNEQKKIANYLSNIDNKIEIINKQITQTQIFKKGLLQQMFV